MLRSRAVNESRCGGQQIDIFTIWMLILLAIGFAAINPKKLPGSRAFSMACGVWAVWVLIRTGPRWSFLK